jgi:hypothetical protein
MRHQATGFSKAAGQEVARRLTRDDLVAYLKETCHEESVLQGLERLRVA